MSDNKKSAINRRCPNLSTVPRFGGIFLDASVGACTELVRQHANELFSQTRTTHKGASLENIPQIRAPRTDLNDFRVFRPNLGTVLNFGHRCLPVKWGFDLN